MSKAEIQNLIDTAIAGQGSAVDVGGALPKILSEILNAAFAGANVQSDWNEDDNTDPSFIKNKPDIAAIAKATIRPINLSFYPATIFDQQAQLDAIGLTVDEIKAAARGERTGVTIDSFFYQIVTAGNEGGGQYLTLIFYGIDAAEKMRTFKIWSNGTTCTVTDTVDE